MDPSDLILTNVTHQQKRVLKIVRFYFRSKIGQVQNIKSFYLPYIGF